MFLIVILMNGIKKIFVSSVLLLPTIGRIYAQDAPVMTGKPNGFFNTTEKNAITDSRRNLPVDKVIEENKNKWFYERYYKQAKYYMSLGDHIEFAKNRLGLEKNEYHKLLLVDESEKNPNYDGKIGRLHIPPNPKGKPLILLFSGNGEKIFRDKDRSGISYAFHKLKEDNNATVVWFRSGFVMDEFKKLLWWDGNYAYEHEIIYTHTKNLIKDLVNEYKPSEIKMAGYSWGGGTIAELSKESDILGENGEEVFLLDGKQLPIGTVVIVDGIQTGARRFANPIKERPQFSNAPNYKLHWYYHTPFERSNFTGGVALSDITKIHGVAPTMMTSQTVLGYHLFNKTRLDVRDGDIIEKIKNTDHNSIDYDVKEKIYNALRK